MNNIELSFQGTVWKCSFYVGVYKALVDVYGYDKLKDMKVAGTSSGVLVALAIALGYKWQDLDKIYKLIAKYSNEYGNYGITSLYLDIFLDIMLKSDDDYKKVNGKLFVGVTKFFKQSHVISHWNNNDELKDTVRESANIPFYIWRNVKTLTIDGCLSGGFVKLSNNTLFISADKGEGHIYPSNNISFSLLDSAFTIQEPKYSQSVIDGYNQTKNFFNESNGQFVKIETKPMSDSITFFIWSLYFTKTYWKPIFGISVGLLTFGYLIKKPFK
jgi:hypothetical protein